MRCTQTGCPGTYVDGYCDFCGFPAPDGAETNRRSGVYTATARSTADAEAHPPTTPAAPTPVPPPAWAHPGPPAAAASTPRPATTGPTRPAPTFTTPARGAWTGRAGTVTLGSARGTGVTRRVRADRGTRRAGLGAGLTQVPAAPVTDPAAAVMTNPVLPEEKRNCPSCGAPVGRSRDGVAGRTEGYCPQCRNPYSFTPKLAPGDLVAGQYEVVGPLAHGGLGWVYLARDKNVSDRPVVLKGLLNAGDADALAAAVAEQQFLAQVEHPLIVEVYNVVAHGGAGYTVMEYVGGRSLKDLLKDRMAANGGVYDPLPIDHALAFVLEILPAFAYLHDLGLLYCDFKPDNLIQVGAGVKLIDLGGVRRLDDLDSPIYGTVGYQAPEIAEDGPSVASDIYTIGRTLAVLTNEFRGYQSVYATSLPPLAQLPAFAASDPFYRLVAKACAPDAADRFHSVDELRSQLLGVLRQVAFDRRGVGAAGQAGTSTLFEPPYVTDETLGWWELPALRPDETDPMIGWLQTLHEQDPQARRRQLETAPERTPEVLLELVRTTLRDPGADTPPVTGYVDELLAADPWEWRAAWMLGLDALSRDDTDTAKDAFAAVYAQIPGELAPRLAAALTQELSGDDQGAEASYLTCLRTDAAYVTPAAFGLMRLRAARRDFRGAVTALDLVPAASAARPRARWLRAELSTWDGGLVAYDDALTDIRTLDADPRLRADFRVRVLRRALDAVLADGPRKNLRVDGVPATENTLRTALESAYRTLASLTRDDDERFRLVDHANAVRPWSLR